MSLVTAKEILTLVTPGKAIGAFNVHNLEDVQAVVWAAEELCVPVILQVSQSGAKHALIPYIAPICRFAGQRATIPVAIQLDHGTELGIVQECIEHGFTSVMIDGSSLPYEENIAITKQVVEMAHQRGVSVEGELGTIGGKEDDMVKDYDDAALTDPDQAVNFVERTGIDIFAPAIGTAHGLYTGEPKLDFDRLKAIRQKVSIPLVLHGGSDLSVQAIRSAISAGATKINVGTELKYAYTNALKAFFMANPQEFEPRNAFTAARAEVQRVVKEKILLFEGA